jgi:aspartyl-tRNA(Asn)/glutamyl-tRNA(Gln) amidotransferase subunit C
MKLTIADVEHVARLARLGLTPLEKERLQEQLSSILDHIEALGEIDTGPIPPTAQVGDQVNVMRPDNVRPSLSQTQVLSNAPRQTDGFFEVDAVFGGTEDDDDGATA